MFRKLWHEWLRVARLIGSFNARALITLVYFVLIAPFGMPIRLFSDPLRMKRPRGAGPWLARRAHDLDLETARRQG
ncbi:MAG: hypothetical protein D6791_07010 [Chloroflexi bacterium]|nr:MAG: hypothetical protein D6791_07010 [Chloroflexota bacterium]